MQTMSRHGITDVLTDDHHFEQEGLPRAVPPIRKSRPDNC
jgi:hypothetical protein